MFLFERFLKYLRRKILITGYEPEEYVHPGTPRSISEQWVLNSPQTVHFSIDKDGKTRPTSEIRAAYQKSIDAQVAMIEQRAMHATPIRPIANPPSTIYGTRSRKALQTYPR